jgi:tetratricopeptide (TPR) repeat protein
MNTIDLETASSEIQQACEGTRDGGRLPYFFLVGAGVSYPPIKLAYEIQDDCKSVAEKYKRTAVPQSPLAIDAYSYWFDKAYPQPSQRQRYLRSLIAGKPISQANFRLAHLLLEARIANLVITTNFDDFLARALTLFGKQPIVCDHPYTVDRIDPEERDDIQIVHVHGSYWFYDCCNLRSEIVARAQSAAQSTLSMPALLENILWRRMPLVIGYSGWEGDVVMAALHRRLQSPLPNRLYWFCYRQDSIDPLPDWLKSHENVYFVIPQKSAQESVVEPSEGEIASQARTRTALQADVKSKTAKGSEEPTLSAQQVLDKLIQTFALSSPMLTSDPLGYFADYLRSSLPQEEAGRSAEDLYFIKSVVERIERAKQREEADRRALRLIESKMEDIRDALRRSQYREAINQAKEIQLDDMTPVQLRELVEAIWSATTLLADNSEDEIRGYDMIFDIYEILSAIPNELEIEGLETTLDERAARALLDKAITLGELNRHEEELAAYDRVLEKFGGAKELQIIAVVADTLINKGLALGELKRDDDELSAYDEVIRRYDELNNPDLLDQCMKALFNKGVVLGALGRFEEAIAVCDEVTRRFGDAQEPSLHEASVQVLVNKGYYLGKLNRHDEEIAVYEQVVNRFAEEAESSEQVAKALLNKALALGALKRTQEAITTCDELTNRYGQAVDPVLREMVVQTLLTKGFYLRELNLHEDAIAAYDEVIKRTAEATEISLREALAKAFARKGMALAKLERHDEAAAAFEEVLSRFEGSTEVPLRQRVAQALNGIGFTLLLEAKLALIKNDNALGDEFLLKAQDRFNRGMDYKPDDSIIMANQGYAAFLLGEKEKARQLLAKSIEIGGEEIRELELEDAQVHRLPQDEEFQALLRSFPISESKRT